MSKLEIEHVAPNEHKYMTAALIAIATGYDLLEVWERLPPRLRKNGGWYARDFRHALELLGFNCGKSFNRKFDPATDQVCLMRFGPTKRALVENRSALRAQTGDPTAQLSAAEKDWWDVAVYYNGLVYLPTCAGAFPLDAPWITKYWRITSMMPVWISTETVIREL